MVFRLDAISGEPKSDGVETLDAGYFSVDELEGKEGVQALSRWAIRSALVSPPGSGFVSDGAAFEMRPGWSLFGLAKQDS